MTATDLAANWLLARMPDDVRAHLQDHASPKTVLPGEILFDARTPLHWAIFPLRGLISLQMDADDQQFREILSIGKNGMVGAPGLVGGNRTDFRAVAALPGLACWFPTQLIQEVVDQMTEIRGIFADFFGVVLRGIGRNSVCSGSHPAHRRIASWIARASSLSGTTELEITQQALGQLLSLRQATISEACSTLQEKGAVSVSRGVIKVQDRGALEAESCGCGTI